MSRTLITGLVFSAVTIFAVLAISPAGMHPGGFNVTQAADASETGVVNEGRENQESELQKLLFERKKVLSRIVESMKLFLESGRVDFNEYRDANIALLRAEMDMCRNREERLEIMQKKIKFHSEYETQGTRREAEGRAHAIDVNKAKVTRLEARMELIREKLKG